MDCVVVCWRSGLTGQPQPIVRPTSKCTRESRGLSTVSDSSPTDSLLAHLAGVLSQRAVPWYLFGAQAVVLWGRPRLTADFDVTVRLPDGDLSAFVADMAEAGFQLRVPDAQEFVRRARVLPFVHAPSGVPLDLVLAGPGLEEEFLRRVRWMAIAGRQIPVISPEDLLITKVLAGRPKDIEDVQGVLAAQAGTLDLGWVREALGMLEQALGQSDLLPVLEAELARLKR